MIKLVGLLMHFIVMFLAIKGVESYYVIEWWQIIIYLASMWLLITFGSIFQE